MRKELSNCACGGGGSRLNAPNAFLDACKNKKICYYSDMVYHNDNGVNMKKAFTLAEVLITLGVIGVVAAMTMPSLIANHQKKVCVNQLKKTYTTLYNAINMSKAQNGDIQGWSFIETGNAKQSTKNFVDYIAPNLNITKIHYDNYNSDCKNITYRNMDKTKTDCSKMPMFCDTCNVSNSNDAVRIDLADGSMVNVLVKIESPYNNIDFFVDTNGYKGPNTWGKDLFRFSLRDNGSEFARSNDYVLCGGDCHPREFDLANHCVWNYAFGCAEVIIGDGWEIKEDYPWK